MLAAPLAAVALGLGGGIAALPAQAAHAAPAVPGGSYWEGPEAGEGTCWVRVSFWHTNTGRDFTCVWSDGTHYGRGWWVYMTSDG